MTDEGLKEIGEIRFDIKILDSDTIQQFRLIPLLRSGESVLTHDEVRARAIEEGSLLDAQDGGRITVFLEGEYGTGQDKKRIKELLADIMIPLVGKNPKEDIGKDIRFPCVCRSYGFIRFVVISLPLGVGAVFGSETFLLVPMA